MDEPEFNSEKRLLLAFALTLLVLAGWPYFSQKMGWMPPPSSRQKAVSKLVEEAKKAPKAEAPKQAVGLYKPPTTVVHDVKWSTETTSSKIGFSTPTASLSELTIRKPSYKIQEGELELLKPTSGPGLGAVAWGGAQQAWEGFELVAGGPREPEAIYQGELAPGLVVEKRFDLSDPTQNSFTLSLSVTNRTESTQTIQPRILAVRNLNDPLDKGRYRVMRTSVDGKTKKVKLGRGVSETHLPGEVAWVTAQTKYYATIMEPKTPAAGVVVTRDALGQPQGWVEWSPVVIAPGTTENWKLRGYVGPIDYRILEPLYLDRAVSLGAFTTMTRLLMSTLNWFTTKMGNPGTAIVLVTLCLSILFYPLTFISFKAMKKMEMVQPEMAALKAKHGKDPKRMNEEMMKLYKKHKVNPLSGCLPLLLQMPIFISLYQVLSRSPELRGAQFLLIKDLAAPDQIIPLPGTLPFLGSAINVLPLAMGFMMFLQQRLSMRGKTMTEEQKMQQKIFTFMPILFGVLFYSLPSGLVLYWLLNTTFVVAQQRLVMKKLAK